MNILKKLSIISLIQFSNLCYSGEELVPVRNIFVPHGYIAGEHAEVLITGYLPNLCYKAPRGIVKKDGKKIYINMIANNKDVINSYCADVIVPFVETIDLGEMEKGDYQIIVNFGSPMKKVSALSVGENLNNNREIYAAVYDIVKKEERNSVVLKGYHPSDCFDFKSVEIVSNGKDAYTVFPRLSQSRAFCPKKEIRFNYEVKLPNTLREKQILIHVKTMDGKGINTIFRPRVGLDGE